MVKAAKIQAENSKFCQNILNFLEFFLHFVRMGVIAKVQVLRHDRMYRMCV